MIAEVSGKRESGTIEELAKEALQGTGLVNLETLLGPAQCPSLCSTTHEAVNPDSVTRWRSWIGNCLECAWPGWETYYGDC